MIIIENLKQKLNAWIPNFINWRNQDTVNQGDNVKISELQKIKGIFGYRKFLRSADDGFGDSSGNSQTSPAFSGMVGNGVIVNGEGGGFIIHQRGDGAIFMKSILTEDSTDTAWFRLDPLAYSSINTPYHTTKMQQLGIYEDFIFYMDSQHEYDKEQKALELAKQEAYQLALAENSELVYEEWLSSYPELMPIHQEPVPSEALQAFYNEYK